MTLQGKAIVFIFVTLALVLTLIFCTYTFQQLQTEQIRQELLSDRTQNLQFLLAANGGKIRQWYEGSLNFSVFSELLSGHPKLETLKRLEETLQSLGLDGIWVQNQAQQTVLSVNRMEVLPPELNYRDLFAVVNYRNFYMWKNQQLIEYHVHALIVDRDAIGYIIVARVWSPTFLRSLAQTIHAQVVPIANPSGAISLLDENGKNIGSLAVDLVPGALDQLRTTGLQYSLALFAIIVIGSSLLIYTSVVLVVRPISKLTDALKTKQTQNLKSILNNKDEFGQLAQLVVLFFGQQATLETTVEQYKRTAETLQQVQTQLKESYAERIRLGRDLHDGIIQSLFAMGLQIENLRKKHITADAQLMLLRDSMNSTIRDIRSFIAGIEPDHAQHDLVTEIHQFVREFQDERITVTLLENVQREVNKATRQQLYYIVKEAVANAMKHSNATKIVVQVSLGLQYVQITIVDNGCGFVPTAESLGRGLQNMQQRTEALGGKYVLTSTPKGTEVSITLA